MSEPTYRVELTHDPSSTFNSVPWKATVYRVSDDEQVDYEYGATREAAFDAAQRWVKRTLEITEPSSTVYLTEDGDILDPHEVQR